MEIRSNGTPLLPEEHLPPIPADFAPRLTPSQPPAGHRRRRKLLAGALLGLTGLTAAGAVLASTCTLCYAVSTDGVRPLAFVQGTETYQAAVAQVEDQVSQILREDYDYAQQTSMALTIAPKDSIQDPEQLTDRLMETVDQVKAEYILTIDGRPVAACESRQAIDRALWTVKERYRTPNTVAAYFGSTIAVEEGYLPADTEVLDAEALVQRLTQPSGQVRQAVDQLAQALSSSQDASQEDAIPVAALSGDQTAAPWQEEQPLLSVRTVEEVTYTRPVEPTVEEIPDSSLLVGERQVLQEGTAGLEEITDRVTYTMGQEQSRETMSLNLLTQPTPTQVAVGTAQGAEGAKGRFLWPLSGRISSPFGDRTIFGGESFHRGLDIAAPSGTPITASAAGQVIWSGPKGTYGNLVKLDHGNGYVTYYAHCSSLLVEEGDWVEQGETIALVGSTGRSTGPHCHFELLWQGELLDPQLCLP